MIAVRKRKLLLFFLLMPAAGAFLGGIQQMIIFIVLFAVLFADRQLSCQDMCCLALFGGILLTLASAGVIAFQFFPQALDLYRANTSLLFWFRSGHLHAVRLMIVYPAVWICRWNNTGLNEAFTWYSCAVVGLLGFYLLRLLKMTKALTRFNRLAGLAVLLVLSYLMNGRLLYAFLGIEMVLDAEFRYQNQQLRFVALKVIEITGLILTMVSSGTMTVTAVYILIMSVLQWKEMRFYNEKIHDKKMFFVLCVLLLYPFTALFFPYFLRFLKKNIDYYGGGIQGLTGIMQHGFGKFFYSDSAVLYILLVIVAMFILFMNGYIVVHKVIKRKSTYFPLLLIINICVYGGVFGYSTALLAFMPLVVLLLSTVGRRVSV